MNKLPKLKRLNVSVSENIYGYPKPTSDQSWFTFLSNIPFDKHQKYELMSYVVNIVRKYLKYPQ